MRLIKHTAVLCVAVWLPVCSALTPQVVSSFVFTRHGDRTPYASDNSPILTPYGARQMYDAGIKFRNRYLTNTFDSLVSSTAIQDISHYQLNADEVSILTTDHEYTVASAQAFMQGLYPPLADSTNYNYTQILGVSGLANGSNIVAPLDGYQYPNVRVASSYDLKSVWLDGSQNCPALTEKLIEYYNTSDFDFLYKSTLDFYRGLEDDFLESHFTTDYLGYFDSYYIYDFMQYQYLHNSTFHDKISDVNMTRAEILAADWVHAMYANSTDVIKSVAGRSLASQIVNNFYTAIESQGQTNKLNLWFGDFAPMVGLAALSGLISKQNAIFFDVPAFGSSFIFELVSLLPDDDTSTSFPDESDLYVRFYYQNGTDQYSDAVEYSLFGGSPSTDLVPWQEFVAGFTSFSLSGMKEWCAACGSYSIFCPAYMDDSASENRHRQGKLSPAIAGVIGALVTLAVAALLFGLLMAFAGLRFHRRGKKASDLGGFRGSQKLASDQDLTLPKGAPGAVVTTTESDSAKGHERVGSWELREAAKRKEAGQIGAATTTVPPRRPSYEDDEIHVDPYARPVKPSDQV